MAVVPPETRGCHADRRHLHLQVRLRGAVYDVALPLGTPEQPDVYVHEAHAPLPHGPWREGWHTDSVELDYARTLGVRSTQFVHVDPSELARKVTQSLERASRVAIYANGYGGHGAHEVHRDHGRRDGAVVLDPESAAPTWLLFRFERQRF